MGYSYGVNPRTGREMLACDNCSKIGGVIKFKCSEKVYSDNARSQERYGLNYCYPPALCGECRKKIGKTVHAKCKENAAKSQAEYDANQAKLDAGDKMAISAWGDWAEGVPKGFVRVMFSGAKYSNHEYYIIPAEEYEPENGRRKLFLSEYPNKEFQQVER